MDPTEEIRRALATELVEEDGDTVVLELAPGLSEEAIDALAREVSVPLPSELRRTLAYTAEIDGVLETVDFTGRRAGFEAAELFPSGLAIAHDGFGNHWVVDLTPDEAESAPVFFACHDAPVVLFQSPNLGHFLRETFRMYVPPHASLVDDVHEDRLFNVWRTNPGVIEHSTALASDDEDIRDFAAELDERFLLVDLRSPEIGMGFSWGRFGPDTEVRRRGYQRLFAYARPEKKPGLLRRLLG